MLGGEDTPRSSLPRPSTIPIPQLIPETQHTYHRLLVVDVGHLPVPVRGDLAQDDAGHRGEVPRHGRELRQDVAAPGDKRVQLVVVCGLWFVGVGGGCETDGGAGWIRS